MAKKRFVTEKRYEVDWYRNGFCYRTTTNVTWEGVKDMKKMKYLTNSRRKRGLRLTGTL